MTLIRAQGYPQHGKDGNGSMVYDQYYDTYANAKRFLDDLIINSRFTDDPTLFLVSAKLKKVDGDKGYIDLTYGAASLTVPEEGKASYSLNFTTEERPIEKHPDYLANWNYYLIALAGTATPAFWSTAKTIELSASDAKIFKWVKGGTGDKMPDGWACKPKTKNAETYPIPCPVVEEVKWYSSERSSNQAAAKIYTRLTPAETYGRTGGEWLVVACSKYTEKRRFRVSRSFQWSPLWDHDLYPAG